METRERLETTLARLLTAADGEDTRAALSDLLRDFLPDGATIARCDVCGRETLHAGAVCARCSSWEQWQAAIGGGSHG